LIWTKRCDELNSSIIFRNLNDEELEGFFKLMQIESIEIESIGTIGISVEVIESLKSKNLLISTNKSIKVNNIQQLIPLFLKQVYAHQIDAIKNQSTNEGIIELRNYLITVQKHLSHVEAEGKKSFLNIRTLVDKFIGQGKDYLEQAFKKAMDKNSETGEWVIIPHISPVGIYDPINQFKGKITMVINELENSLNNLLDEYNEFTHDLLQKHTGITLEADTILYLQKTLTEKKIRLDDETKKFGEEVNISLNEQIHLLEKNLAKDLMEQFSAIEKLNELKPERIWLMLEETRSELQLHLNGIYSRILREINTLQLQVDIQKISLILTNEAGKTLKRITNLQSTEIMNLNDLMDLINKYSSD